MNIIIKNYKLEFKPNLKSFTFNCDEIITLEITKSKLIKLDMVDLQIHECSVYFQNELVDTNITYCKDKLLVELKNHVLLVYSITARRSSSST